MAVGRPGEPLLGDQADGVQIKRYLTTDMREWSQPEVVLDLPNGWRPDATPGENDGAIWTPKSMDRDPSSHFSPLLFFHSPPIVIIITVMLKVAGSRRACIVRHKVLVVCRREVSDVRFIRLLGIHIQRQDTLREQHVQADHWDQIHRKQEEGGERELR